MLNSNAQHGRQLEIGFPMNPKYRMTKQQKKRICRLPTPCLNKTTALHPHFQNAMMMSVKVLETPNLSL